MPNEQPSRSPQPRAAVTKADGKAVLVFFPKPVVEAVDRLVHLEDTDRSKWIRLAIREALHRRGVSG